MSSSTAEMVPKNTGVVSRDVETNGRPHGTPEASSRRSESQLAE